jgi:hypothetical protein
MWRTEVPFYRIVIGMEEFSRTLMIAVIVNASAQSRSSQPVLQLGACEESRLEELLPQLFELQKRHVARLG